MKKKLLIISILAVFLSSCHKKDDLSNINFRQEMRNFVKAFSNYAKEKNPNFLIIPQNGQALITDTGEPGGTLQSDYVAAIDGTGREDMFYGYIKDDEATPSNVTQEIESLCDLFEQNNVQVMVTDYCSTHWKMDDSYTKNEEKGYISFAAPDRGLSVIPDYPPEPHNVNADDVTSLSQAQNFLYLINPGNYSSKDNFLNDIASTNYDIVLIDLFFNDNLQLTADDINKLKTKQNGGRRLVICYMSIGEAEDYRYYWQKDWKPGNPAWLEAENPDWKGNYKVRYWDKDWQNITFGSDGAYLDRILNAGFDGVYLDIIDGYEYFEQKYN